MSRRQEPRRFSINPLREDPAGAFVLYSTYKEHVDTLYEKGLRAGRKIGYSNKMRDIARKT